MGKILADAGVTNPPTVFFYKDDGRLLVQGSREQLALVNRLVLKLNDYPTNVIAAIDKQFFKQTGTNGFEAQAATNLFTRTFRVDPVVFKTALLDQPASMISSSFNSPSGINSVSTMARNFFSALGVDLTTAGKSIFFNDRLGLLTARGTMDDLDMIESALEALNTVTPQIHIKARFVKVTQNENTALGFDWYLGHFSVSNNMAGKGGGSPSPAAPVSAVNPLGVFPGNTTFNSGGLQNSNPAVASVTGILTDTNFRVVLHALSASSKLEVLGEPEVTTISGRRTIMKATETITVITNFTFQETATNSGVSPQMEKLQTGPVLDTVAYVLADGYTIDLSIKASYSEFLGYDKPTNATATVYTKAGVKIDVPTISPRIETRQASAHINIWDNQTVVLGGMIIPSIQTTKEKVPLLGDLPILGHLFQSQSKTEIKKKIMVFVTATIVDPAGNRVHSEEEMPFAKDAVPQQPAKN